MGLDVDSYWHWGVGKINWVFKMGRWHSRERSIVCIVLITTEVDEVRVVSNSSKCAQHSVITTPSMI